MGLARAAIRATSSGSSGLATPERWVEEWFAGGEATAAGVRVSEETALHYAPFFAGVRLIAEDVGSLPLITYERLADDGKSRARNHSLYGLLHDAPNDVMSAITFRSTLQAHALTWPAGYAYVVREHGEVTELWPLRPDRIHPDTRTVPGQPGKVLLSYKYLDPVNNIQARLLPDEVFAVGGLGFDGISGYSIISLARQSIALGLAAERYGASVFGNGSKPGGVLKHPKTLSEGAQNRLRANWENLHRGLDRAQRVAILEEGLDYEAVGIPPNDAQFLETRRFQVSDQARWLRLPPHKIADLERATFSNIEEQALDYVTGSLRIWLVRWEQSIKLRLFTMQERARFFAEHLVDGLLRGDIKTRYEAYAIGRQWGWLSADDIRALENLNPLPDGRGSIYLVPLNMVPAPTPAEAALSGFTGEVIDGEVVDEEGRRRAERLARALRGRGTEMRRRIAKAFRPKVAEADLRLAKLERAEVASLIRRHLTPRDASRVRSVAEFLAAVEALYTGLVADRTVKAWLPVLSELAMEIAADAAADVGHDGEIDLQAWIAAYVDSHADYRVGTSIGQLRKVVEGLDVEEAAEAATARLDKWVEERPARAALWHTNQLPNAAARETWRRTGVRQLRWVASGDTCPFCTRLDGETVGIETPFVAAGGEVTGLEETLNIDRATFHPPLHPGCDCTVVPA